MDDTETGLPASLEAAWGLRERPSKGPKRGLSLARIVEAAIKIAASEGLAAVSMSRVASDLGVSTMALYRYVDAKDELLALMVDVAGGTPPPPASPDEGWRAGLSRWAWGFLDVLRRHPWILRVPITAPPITPNQIVWLEDGLRSMRGTGLEEGEKLSVVLLLSGFVRNYATLMADISVAATQPGSTAQRVMSAYGRLLARLTDAQRFPAIHAVIAAGAFDDDDSGEPVLDDEFTFGLERVLDGIDVLVRSRSRGGPASSS